MPIIKVRSKSPSFRRAGLSFTKEAVDLNTEDLSKKQLAALKAEPMLIIEEAEPERKSGSNGNDDNKGGGQQNGSADPAERMVAVKAAIAKLDKNNAALWTRDGRPNLDALSEAAGFRVTPAERDQALAEINAPAST